MNLLLVLWRIGFSSLWIEFVNGDVDWYFDCNYVPRCLLWLLEESMKAMESILLTKVSGFLILVPWGLLCYKYAVLEREWIDRIILEIVLEMGCYWLYDLIGNHMCMLKLSCEGMRQMIRLITLGDELRQKIEWIKLTVWDSSAVVGNSVDSFLW